MSNKDEVEEKLEELVFGTRDAITEEMAIVSDEEDDGVKKTRVSKFNPAWIDEDDDEDFEFDETNNPKWARYIIDQRNEESLWAQDSVTEVSDKIKSRNISFDRLHLKRAVEHPKFVQFHDSGALVLAATSRSIHIFSTDPNDNTYFLRREVPRDLTACKFTNGGKELIWVHSSNVFYAYDIETEIIQKCFKRW
jgi:hypothetical protein